MGGFSMDWTMMLVKGWSSLNIRMANYSIDEIKGLDVQLIKNMT
jgi:hypothetical protein